MTGFHRTLLLGCTAVITLSILLTADADAVYLFGWQLPESCFYQRVWNKSCLGCGLTRSFVHMGHLDVAGAFERHAVGPLMWLGTVLQIPYRSWRLWRLKNAESVQRL